MTGAAKIVMTVAAAAGFFWLLTVLQSDGRTCRRTTDSARIEACTRVINAHHWYQGNLAWAYTNRGNAYRRKGQLAEALGDYDASIELYPGRSDTYYNRGLVYKATNKLDL